MTKIAAIQLCSGTNLNQNLESAGKLIQTAAENGAQLVVLPEMFASLGNALENKEVFGHGKIQDFLSQTAQKNNIWIIGGTIPLEIKNSSKIRAACLVFNNQGKFVIRYDKINLFDIEISAHEKYAESDSTEPGDEIICFDSPFGKIGLAICYDIRFPDLFKKLITQGAEIIALPAAFTVPTGTAHWKILAQGTAVYNLAYFIGACQGGKNSPSRETYGHSVIIHPWGNILAEKADNQPGIIYADIDLTEVHKARKIIPILGASQ